MMAEKFSAAGSRVALVARNGPELQQLADAVGGAAYPADLADPAQLRDLVARVEDDGGPVDVLVNNAGLETARHLVDLTADQVEAVVRLNLLAPVELTRQALPGMLARGTGHIVAMSSLAGVATFPGFSVYAATKAGLTHFMSGVRADIGDGPVRTTVVELGPVVTSMLDRAYDYRPTERSFERMYRLGLLVELPVEPVAAAVVAAVASGRRHVRLPRRAALVAAVSETPRRAVELLLRPGHRV